jgi:hypothetical protein
MSTFFLLFFTFFKYFFTPADLGRLFSNHFSVKIYLFRLLRWRQQHFAASAWLAALDYAKADFHKTVHDCNNSKHFILAPCKETGNNASPCMG